MLEMCTFSPGSDVSAYIECLCDQFGHRPVDRGIGCGGWGQWAGRFLGGDRHRALEQKQLSMI